MKKLIFSLTCCLAAGQAIAEDNSYIQILTGKTDYRMDSYYANGDASASGLRGGYFINDNLAFEMSYMRHGKANNMAVNNDFFNLERVLSKVSSINFGTRGYLSLGINFKVSAKLGIGRWTSDTNYVDANNAYSDWGSSSGFSRHYGVGAHYEIGDKVMLGLEYSKLNTGNEIVGDTGNSDLSTLALSVGLKI